ncbi:MAG: sulfurtransferase TusA family protein [Candidatus Electrothrix sp. YB6]
MIHYALPPSLDDDIFRFEHDFAEFGAGRLHETAFTAKRVKMGVYLERNYTTYMCRIRCSGNIISPQQLAAVAELARKYGNSRVHVTTRAELQLHRIEEGNVVAVLRGLQEAGLACIGGGGNTIRNIIANHDSGISPDEVFDVLPCIIALTDRLIAEPDSWEMPRKVKIAFSSLAEEQAFCHIHDIGFVARRNTEGEQGFRVHIGGGLGARPKAAVLLHEFIPEEDVYHVVKAVKKLFHHYGNRKNKHRNRIKFLLHDDLGIEAFRTYYEQELSRVVDRGHAKLYPEPIDNTGNINRDIDLAPQSEHSDDFQLWKKRHVAAQKQKGLCRIRLPLSAGDLQAGACCALEEFLRPFGENTLRFGTDQNLYLINIPKTFLANIYHAVMNCSTLNDKPRLYGNLVCCAGAQGCQVGITSPKPAAQAIFDYLDTLAAEDFCPPNDIMIRMSGCPNSCSNHWIADLGFYGRVRRVDGHLIPTYNVLGNGGVHQGKFRIAEEVGWVHAYDLPRFIAEVMRRYINFKEQDDSDHAVNFNDYWCSGGREIIRELCASGYHDIPSFADDKNYYFDHGADQLFSVSDLGQAECSAGMYDMIDADDRAVRKNLRRLDEQVPVKDEKDGLSRLLQDTLFRAARMLMITRGEEPGNESEVYPLFVRHFLDTGLVDASYRPLIELACQGKTDTLLRQKERIVAFAREIRELYRSMDNTMRFPGETENMALRLLAKDNSQMDELTPDVEPEPQAKGRTEESADSDSSQRKPDRFKDLSGVKCPLNFAQTKVQLFGMNSGELLEIILDEGPPIKNVPGSVELEGHTILRQEKIGAQWSVLIRKA